jgi:hypothetical protein
MARTGVAFGIERVVAGVVERGDQFAAAHGQTAGLAIFSVIFVFHLVEGAAELAKQPGSCRFFEGKFWIRIFMVTALLGGYRTLVAGTVGSLQPKYMTAFATHWADVWVAESDAIDSIRKAESENQDLKYGEVAGAKAGKEDDSWIGKASRYVVDGIITGIGWALACLAGLLITLFILMEGFWALGVNMLLIGIGPICIACAAHEKSEAMAWSFFRAFLVLGLLYMPMLGLGCEFAGVIMAQMAKMVVGSGVVYGDGTDIGVHLLMVLLGPICAFAVVRAVPSFMSMLLQTGAPGAGAGFAAAAVVAQQGVRTGIGVVASGGGSGSDRHETNGPRGSGGWGPRDVRGEP